MATRKKTTASTTDTVSIHDACFKYMTTEQGLRLALNHVRPDDFDTVKAVSEADLEAIALYFQPKSPTVASSTSELPENLQKFTQQTSEPATEQQQNALSLQGQQQHLATPTQFLIPNAQLTLIDQLARQASEEITAIDAITQVKNQIILNNLAARESELTEQVNQRWQHQKQGYLGSIRSLADLAQQKPEITQDDTDLTQEIDQILGDLEKKLIV